MNEAAVELGAAVRETLERLQPSLRGAAGHEVRIAVRLLQTLERELALGEAAREAERTRLQGLLPDAGDLPLAALRERLCEALLAGRIGVDDAALRGHLWRTTRDRLAIDSPGYQWREPPTRRS